MTVPNILTLIFQKIHKEGLYPWFLQFNRHVRQMPFDFQNLAALQQSSTFTVLSAKKAPSNQLGA